MSQRPNYCLILLNTLSSCARANLVQSKCPRWGNSLKFITPRPLHNCSWQKNCSRQTECIWGIWNDLWKKFSSFRCHFEWDWFRSSHVIFQKNHLNLNRCVKRILLFCDDLSAVRTTFVKGLCKSSLGRHLKSLSLTLWCNKSYKKKKTKQVS